MNIKLQEASLSRVWQHAESDRPIALMSAFRGEFTREDNLKRNRDLASMIREMGYGFFYVDGYWIENQGKPDERHVAEDSLFIVGKEGDDKSFLANLVQAGARFNQDAVLVKTSLGAKLYDQAGNAVGSFSQLSPGKMGEIYTRLRNNKKANTFIFENERDDMGWLQRLAGIQKN